MGPAGFRVFADPVHFRYTQAPMRELLIDAFQMQWDQFVGPNWAISDDPTDRYEIEAKNYPGAPMKQVYTTFG